MNAAVQGGVRRLLWTLFGVYLGSLICAVCVVVGVTSYHQTQIAGILARTVRNSLIVRDLRQAILDLEPSTPSRFLSIGFFDGNGGRVFALPAESGKALSGSSRLWAAQASLPVRLGSGEGRSLGELRFVYNPFGMVPYTIGLWVLFLIPSLPLAANARRKILEQHEMGLQHERAEALAQLASQVAHDIRSPLAGLLALSRHCEGIDAESRTLLQSTATRIRDIAEGLLRENKEPAAEVEAMSLEALAPRIESVLSEFRVQLRDRPGIRLTADLAPDVLAEIQPTEFTRIVSNLVGNAIDSIGSTGFGGTVRVGLAREPDRQWASLTVTDTGQGIPPEVLSKLGERGVTFGKESGSGLGLYHARKTLEGWEGRLEFRSEIGRGTTVTVRLRSDRPQAGPLALSAIPGTAEEVVILDDDPLMHELWKRLIPDRPLIHLGSGKELLAWNRDHLAEPKSRLFLCDLDLGDERMTGLDLIEMLGIASDSVLVTGRAQDPGVIARCRKFSIRLLPKDSIASRR